MNALVDAIDRVWDVLGDRDSLLPSLPDDAVMARARSGARHLAEVIVSRLPEAEWEGSEDQRSQILGWSRTEPVIIGLTVVGGVHLDDGQLSDALDLML